MRVWVLFREVWDATGLEVSRGRYYLGTGDTEMCHATAQLDVETLYQGSETLRFTWFPLQQEEDLMTFGGQVDGDEAVMWRMLEVRQ